MRLQPILTMLQITRQISIPDHEIELQAIRAQGAGGQNVNKVATAIHLRFDIKASSLPMFHKERLLMINDYRISKDAVIIIKAQRFRSQEKNREDALNRLRNLIIAASEEQKKRKATRPKAAAKRRRLDNKSKRGQLKKSRGRVVDDR